MYIQAGVHLLKITIQIRNESSTKSLASKRVAPGPPVERNRHVLYVTVTTVGRQRQIAREISAAPIGSNKRRSGCPSWKIATSLCHSSPATVSATRAKWVAQEAAGEENCIIHNRSAEGTSTSGPNWISYNVCICWVGDAIATVFSLEEDRTPY